MEIDNEDRLLQVSEGGVGTCVLLRLSVSGGYVEERCSFLGNIGIGQDDTVRAGLAAYTDTHPLQRRQ